MLLVFLVAPAAFAQVPNVPLFGGPACLPQATDDGFEVAPCCSPVAAPVLPAFPPLLIDNGQYACFNNCAVEQDLPTVVSVGMVAPTICQDEFLIQIAVSPAGPGAPTFSFSARAQYVRTFAHFQQPQLARQVWRFLVNGSVANFGPGDAPDCPTPSCLAGGNTSQFVGHLDYSCGLEDVGDGGLLVPTWRFSLALTHHAGCVSHLDSPTVNSQAIAAGLPSRHDNRSYHLVAPNGFVFLDAPFPTSAETGIRSSALDAIRTRGGTATRTCVSEIPIQSATARADLIDCLCMPQGQNDIYYHLSMPQAENQTQACATVPASNFNGVGLGPPLPTGVFAQYIGRWQGFTPGVAGLSAFAVFGVLDYVAPCNAAPPSGLFGLNIVFGVATGQANINAANDVTQVLFSNPAAGVGNVPVRIAMDFADAVRNELGVANDPIIGGIPGFGVHETNIIWSLAQ